MGYTKEQIIAAFKEWNGVYIDKEGSTKFSGELTEESHVEYGDHLCLLMDNEVMKSKQRKPLKDCTTYTQRVPLKDTNTYVYSGKGFDFYMLLMISVYLSLLIGCLKYIFS